MIKTIWVFLVKLVELKGLNSEPKSMRLSGCLLMVRSCASFVEKRRFTSFMGGYARMDSIVQEVNRCDPSEKDTFDHALILIQTSKDYPLTMSELQMLQEVTRDLPPEAVIHWGIGINDDLKDKVFLMIVYSK